MLKLSRAALLALVLLPSAAYAHAITGDRVFPATLAVDDPGVSDELTLPQIQLSRPSDGPWQAVTSAEIDKRVTENFGVSAGGAWIGNESGFDNFGAGAKYVFFKNAPHEVMLSAGLDWDMGGTGAKRVAESSGTLTPALFLGKGMGDLSTQMLRPFAVTGSAGVEMPTDGEERTLDWGFTVQYSLPYLQQHVKDMGLGKLFSTAIPVIEFAGQTPLGGGETTGTVNPGVIFMGQDFQFGLEAVVPVNDLSGRGVGAVAQVHFYLDDLFPQTFGKVLW